MHSNIARNRSEAITIKSIKFTHGNQSENNKMNLGKKKIAVALTLSASIGFAQFFMLKASSAPIPSGGEIFKYFNPVHEKSYLNEKQDRLIKKKAFKAITLDGLTAIPNKELGLFAIIPAEKWQDTNYIDHLLANQEVNGLSCLLPWALIEPDEDTFDWKTIDEMLSACAKHNKQLILRISTCGIDLPKVEQAKAEQANTPATSTPDKSDKKAGELTTLPSDTPSWVFEAGIKSLNYKGTDGQTHRMPIFWDGTYLAKWSNFVNELAKRYDKNPHFQSIGITGGGVLGSTKVVPEFAGDKDTYNELETKLKDEYGMNARQLVNHWKYVADVFPKAFQKQHLNFDLAPPTPNRKGQDCLDEIADYLVYRYGERIYLTRQNVKNDKRGFDDYRLMIKYKDDTLEGYQFTPALASEAVKPLLPKVSKNVFDDAISFAEIPAAFFDSTDSAIKHWLTQMRLHLGYQLVLQQLTFPASITTTKSLPVHFVFQNTGDASPKRLEREMDKGVPSSYKMQLEFKDAQGKVKALVRHTPGTPTNTWLGNKPIIWDQELKTPALKPGKYEIYLAIIDDQTNQKINYCNALAGHKQQIGNDLLVGNIEILASQ